MASKCKELFVKKTKETRGCVAMTERIIDLITCSRNSAEIERSLRDNNSFPILRREI